jgi:hypothetical protein
MEETTMRPSTVKTLKSIGLNPDEFTTEYPQSLVGHVVVGDPKAFFTKDKDSLLFEVTGGFGAELGAIGSALFVKRVSDGQEGRIERHDIIAMKKVEIPVDIPTVS